MIRSTVKPEESGVAGEKQTMLSAAAPEPLNAKAASNGTTQSSTKSLGSAARGLLGRLRAHWLPDLRLAEDELRKLEALRSKSLPPAAIELLAFFQKLEAALAAIKNAGPGRCSVKFAQLRTQFWQQHLESINAGLLRKIFSIAPQLYSWHVADEFAFEETLTLYLDPTHFAEEHRAKIARHRCGFLRSKLLLFVWQEPTKARPLDEAAPALSQADKVELMRKRIMSSVEQKEARVSSSNTLAELGANVPLLCEIAQKLKALFLLKRVSNMYLVGVVKYFGERASLRTIVDEKDLLLVLQQIAAKAPEWLKLLDHRTGTVLQLNHAVELPALLRALSN